MSYATMRLKAGDLTGHYRSNDKRLPDHWKSNAATIQEELSEGGEYYGHIQPGAGWREHVELWKAERDGDEDKAAMLRERQEHAVAAIRESFRR